jgi:hypothetical protein
VICLSVASSKTYHRTGNVHPVLGVEYLQNESSLTDAYFAKMGLRCATSCRLTAPRRWPSISAATCCDYTNLELISTISTMETFQKIYRPEIYNANSAAGKTYQPSLQNETIP